MEAPSHESISAATYNRCRELLEIDQRTIEQDRELLTCAHSTRPVMSVSASCGTAGPRS